MFTTTIFYYTNFLISFSAVINLNKTGTLYKYFSKTFLHLFYIIKTSCPRYSKESINNPIIKKGNSKTDYKSMYIVTITSCFHSLLIVSNIIYKDSKILFQSFCCYIFYIFIFIFLPEILI